MSESHSSKRTVFGVIGAVVLALLVGARLLGRVGRGLGLTSDGGARSAAVVEEERRAAEESKQDARRHAAAGEQRARRAEARRAELRGLAAKGLPAVTELEGRYAELADRVVSPEEGHAIRLGCVEGLGALAGQHDEAIPPLIRILEEAASDTDGWSPREGSLESALQGAFRSAGARAITALERSRERATSKPQLQRACEDALRFARAGG